MTPCAIGAYSDRHTSDRCTECPAGTTTVDRGTASIEGCVCKITQYDRDARANVTECVDCPLASTDCKASGVGVTLESLPLKQGYWRATNRSEGEANLRQCFTPSFCKGGGSCYASMPNASVEAVGVSVRMACTLDSRANGTHAGFGRCCRNA